MALGLLLLAASSLYSGYAQLQSSKNQAKLTELNGQALQDDADHKALVFLDEGYRLRQQQAMDYIGAGVEIMGTPLLVMLETKRRTEVAAASIVRTGKNENVISQANASAMRSTGRSSMISSLLTAGGQLLSYK
jgi:hypothetical protein